MRIGGMARHQQAAKSCMEVACSHCGDARQNKRGEKAEKKTSEHRNDERKIAWRKSGAISGSGVAKNKRGISKHK